MEIICKDRVFTLKNGSDVLLHTDANTPMIYVGYGEERVEMYRGNFKLEDHLLERRPLTLTSARVTEQGTELDLEGQLKLLVTEKEGAVTPDGGGKSRGHQPLLAACGSGRGRACLRLRRADELL